MAGTMVAADGLELGDGKSDKELSLLEELGTQCARALRNLSVNRELCPVVVTSTLHAVLTRVVVELICTQLYGTY